MNGNESGVKTQEAHSRMAHIFANQAGSFGRYWQGVLRTGDPIPCVFGLNHRIGQISCADVLERRAQQFTLTKRGDTAKRSPHDEHSKTRGARVLFRNY
jgi:hypothetical protein